MLTRTTYTHPEQLRPSGVQHADGSPMMERIPNHPKRPARAWEVNTWWEETPEMATPEQYQAFLADVLSHRAV